MVFGPTAADLLATCPGSPATGCPPCPQTDAEGRIEGPVTDSGDSSAPGKDASIATDEDSNFIVALVTSTSGAGNNNDVLVRRFDENGLCLGASHFVTTAHTRSIYRYPSIAMNAAGDGRLDFEGAFSASSCSVISGPSLFSTSFTFSNSSSPTTLGVLACSAGLDDHEPSVGVADSSDSSSWVRFDGHGSPTNGVFFDPAGSPAPPIDGCGTVGSGPPYCYSEWQACLAQNADGRFCIVWPVAEASSASPPFDIAIQEFDSK